MFWHCVRFAVYTLVLTTVLLTWPTVIQRYGLRVFDENGPVELAQLAILLCMVIVLFKTYFSGIRLEGPAALLLLLFSWCSIRENNHLFDRLVPYGGWKLVSFVVVTLCAIMASRARASLLNLGWLRGRGLAMVWTGVLIFGPIAQSIGHESLIVAIVPGQYSFNTKHALEEILEMSGYLVCLAGVIEMSIEQEHGNRQLSSGHS